MLNSKLCNQEDFEANWFRPACEKLREPHNYHRKLWEYCFIYQALLERGLLAPGKRGLGFGVGKEPLTAAFASHGSEVLATDLQFEHALQQGWATSNQHANTLDDLNGRGICDPEAFSRLVSYRTMDMNQIAADCFGQFDFTWSSCSLEHLGSMNLSLQFLLNQMQCLRPGGVAIHTTEFNLTSETHTVETKELVIFRRSDIERGIQYLRQMGCQIMVDYTVGTGKIESHVDLPPYNQLPHLRLKLNDIVSTSIVLIINQSQHPKRAPRVDRADTNRLSWMRSFANATKRVFSRLNSVL